MTLDPTLEAPSAPIDIATGGDDRALATVAPSGPHTVVVGAGIGGLATAVRLAVAGHRVTVLEKAAIPGGRNGRWHSEGFTFDTGPSLMLMLEYWEEIFQLAGRRMSDYLDVRQVDPNYRVHFADGTTIEMTTRLNTFLADVERIEPGCGPQVLEYLAHAKRLYDTGLQFISRNFDSPLDMVKGSGIGSLATSGALGDLQKLIGRYVKSEKLKQALSFQALYLGLSPYDALGIYALLPYTELGGGVHYPMGGMHQLPLALERLGKELGITYRYNAPVASLEKHDGRISAVVLASGERIAGDSVVVNADLPWAYQHLLGEPYPDIEKKRFSCSVVLMYIGTNREYANIEHHNFLVSPDMRAACRELFEDHRMPDESPIYLVSTTRTDKSQAPEGCENLFVLSLAPSDHPDPSQRMDWAVEGPKVEARLLERLEQWILPDLRQHIVTKRFVTPNDFKVQYGNLRGEAFGLSHNLMQIGAFRPANQHKAYRNLFFVGQSTHPGCGVPMALISASCVVERMTADRGAARG